MYRLKTRPTAGLHPHTPTGSMVGYNRGHIDPQPPLPPKPSIFLPV